jgi:hypothetical protein
MAKLRGAASIGAHLPENTDVISARLSPCRGGLYRMPMRNRLRVQRIGRE